PRRRAVLFAAERALHHRRQLHAGALPQPGRALSAGRRRDRAVGSGGGSNPLRRRQPLLGRDALLAFRSRWLVHLGRVPRRRRPPHSARQSAGRLSFLTALDVTTVDRPRRSFTGRSGRTDDFWGVRRSDDVGPPFALPVSYENETRSERKHGESAATGSAVFVHRTGRAEGR